VVGPELLRTAFAQWHEHLGCRLAGAWNLPSPLDEIISSHHALPEVGQPHATLRLMIQVTDAMCGKLGMCEGTTDTIFSLRCTDRLGLRRTPAVLRMLEEIPAALESTLGSSYTTSAS
jgi:HD-like signal output (HDOD) protein